MRHTLIFISILLLISCSSSKKQDTSDKPVIKWSKMTERLVLDDEFKQSNDTSFVKSKNIETYEHFNKEGKPLEKIVCTFEGHLKSKIFCKYDKNGEIKKAKFFDKNDEHSQTTFYTYTNKGLLSEEKAVNHKGETIMGYLNFYDRNNNLIEKKEYKDSKENVVRRSEFIYDAQNHQTEQINYKNEKIDIHIYFTIDEQGNHLETFYQGSHYPGKWKMFEDTYDEYNNHLENIWFKSQNDSTKTIFKNSYDSYDNLIKMVRYTNGKPSYITKREIEYY